MILAINTSTPTAEIVVMKDGDVIVHEQWLAERRLAKEILSKIEEVLHQAQCSWGQLSGLVAFQGPGSFTGLRIGITTMNAIAYSQQIPIVGQMGDDWLADGIGRIKAGENDRIVLPEYGAPARITQPKK